MDLKCNLIGIFELKDKNITFFQALFNCESFPPTCKSCMVHIWFRCNRPPIIIRIHQLYFSFLLREPFFCKIFGKVLHPHKNIHTPKRSQHTKISKAGFRERIFLGKAKTFSIWHYKDRHATHHTVVHNGSSVHNKNCAWIFGLKCVSRL